MLSTQASHCHPIKHLHVGFSHPLPVSIILNVHGLKSPLHSERCLSSLDQAVGNASVYLHQCQGPVPAVKLRDMPIERETHYRNIII